MTKIHIMLANFLIFVFFSNALCQESNPDFAAPLDIPLRLSGNFGELRGGHFHAGLDFKTQGVINQKVFSIADGYVSRIKITHGGYGKAVYVSHPELGYMSVYGHLNGFADKINAFVKNQQYNKQSFEIELFPPKNSIKVTKGEQIAWSGNSGSSSGPHLHFEVRNLSNQLPQNGLLYNFDIADHIPPQIRAIGIYPLDDNSFVNGSCEKIILPVAYLGGKYKIQQNKPVVLSGKIGFSIEAYDYLSNAPNRCAPYAISMYIDSSLIYAHKLDEFSFYETRYIQAHIDYEARELTRRSLQRNWRLPNNNLSIYEKINNNHTYTFETEKLHTIEFIVLDAAENESEVSFQVKGSRGETDRCSSKKNNNFIKVMEWDKENSFSAEGVKVYIPAGTLYEDLPFEYRKEPAHKEYYSPMHHIQNLQIPAHKYYTVSIAPENVPYDKLGKTYIVSLNKSGNPVYEGGIYKNGFVTVRTRSFGIYALMLDDEPPVILPGNIWNDAQMGGKTSIRFDVSDKASGIKSYEGFIDNEWVLFEYDPKSNLLEYTFDNERISRNQWHELELTVTDNRDNISVFQTRFFY